MAGQQWVRVPLGGAWDVDRAADGTVRVVTPLSSRVVNGVAWLIPALGLLWCYSDIARRRPIPPDAPGGVVWTSSDSRFDFVCALVVVFLVGSLFGFFLREERRARPGLLEIQKNLLGFRWVKRFTDATLVVETSYGRSAQSAPVLRLFVEAPEGRQRVADISAWPAQWENWESTNLGQLARILSGATGFPVTDPWGEVADWGAAPTVAAPAAGAVEIRHLHTGQVLAQVPGSGLAGADLADAVLEGADLQGADLQGADLRRADLRGASFKNAKLTTARLERTLLTAADLSGADLTGASLVEATLMGATYDAATRWPQGFDPRRQGAVLEEEEPAWQASTGQSRVRNVVDRSSKAAMTGQAANRSTQPALSSFGPCQVERRADGSVFGRVSPKVWGRNAQLYLGVPLFFALVVGLVATAPLCGPGPHGHRSVWGIILFWLLASGPFLGMALATLAYQRTWLACPGLLEVQRSFLGFRWVRRYTDASLALRRSPGGPYGMGRWVVVLRAPGEERFLAEGVCRGPQHRDPYRMTELAELLADATHFPLEGRCAQDQVTAAGQSSQP